MKYSLREGVKIVSLKCSLYLCGGDSDVVGDDDDGLDRVSVWPWSHYHWGHVAVYQGYH